VSEWRKTGQMGFQTRADLQKRAFGWLRKECRSVGGGTVVRFPRNWMLSGECRIKLDYSGVSVTGRGNKPASKSRCIYQEGFLDEQS
jgi:hypothetical protein